MHGALIARQGDGVLLMGPSGAGKSDLALRMLSPPWSWRLVADDQVLLARAGDVVNGTSPAVLAGLLEVRGVGIVTLNHHPSAHLRMVIKLVPMANVPRLPEPAVTDILGLPFHTFKLHSFAVSTPEKLELLLRQVLAT